MNRVVLAGRITKDPELRTAGNAPVVNFSLAINRSFVSQSGIRETDFINCVVFNRNAENLSRYIRKGSLIGVEGRIQTRSYDAQDGTRRYVTEVICDSIHFLESRGAASQNQDLSSYDYDQMGQTPQYSSPEQNRSPYDDEFASKHSSKQEEKSSFASEYEFDDDDLPF